MKQNKVIIIGSGLSGLLNGSILSREGFEVTILEKEPEPGGNLKTFRYKNHEFETGVHYAGSLGPGQVLNRYWKYFGLSDRIRVSRLDPNGFDHILIGTEEFQHAQGLDNFSATLEPLFRNATKGLDQYVCTLREIASAFPLYNLELPAGHREIQYSAQSARLFFTGLDEWKSLHDPFVSMGSVLAGNNFLYAGSPVTPLHVSSLIHHSFISGAYRFIRGSGQIATILADQVRLNGAKIITSSGVVSIDYHDGNFQVKTVSGEIFRAPLLVSSLHPAVTLSMLNPLLLRRSYRQRIGSLAGTVSSFILFLTMKPGAFPYFNYNVYYHKNANVWTESGLTGDAWPAMYLLSMGCNGNDQKFADVVTLMTYMKFEEVKKWEYTGSGKRGSEYLDFKNDRALRLLDLAGKQFPGLIHAIDHITISTPLTYRDYTGIPEGSLYGIAKDFTRPELTTLTARTKVPGLYFTGQNTNLHGLLGVTIGSVLTSGEIIGLDHLLGKIKNC